MNRPQRQSPPTAAFAVGLVALAAMTSPLLPAASAGAQATTPAAPAAGTTAGTAAAVPPAVPAATPAAAPATPPAAPAVSAPAAAKPTPTPAPPEKPKKVEEDPEVKMGREAHEEMLKSGLKLVQDPKIVARVNTIGQKEAAIANKTLIDAGYGSSKVVPYDYHFFIVDDPDVNAFSLPGGYIYINKGLINYVQSDDELAGVIGHEITHAQHHHVMNLQKEQNKLTNQMMLGMLVTFLAHVPTADAFNLMQGFQLIALQKVNGFGQTAEKDADHGGTIITAKAGYNPVGMLTFMERLERDQRMRPDIELGIFRTHPPEKERVAAITAQLREMGIPIRRREVTNSLKVETRMVAVTAAAPSGSAAPSALAVLPQPGGNTGGLAVIQPSRAPNPPGSAAPPAIAAGGPPQQATEVLLDGVVLYRTPSPERAKQAAAALDRLLDDDIQLYDVTRQGSEVRIRGEAVVTVVPEDLILPGSYPTVAVAVDAAYKNLRNVLYKEFLLNSN